MTVQHATPVAQKQVVSATFKGNDRLLLGIVLVVFFRIENSKDNSFVDLSLLKNKTYAGATLSNFLLNGSAGTLLVSLSLVQQGANMTALQAGLLTLGYLIAILVTIRVGEKLLRLWGPRKPMWLGCSITGVGILLTAQAWIYAWQYMILAVIGFTLYGIGLGFYATPSTDAALSNVPAEKAAFAAGIYKMASSLGAAFGVAVSAAIYTGLSSVVVALSNAFMVGRTDNISVRFAAMVALLFNLIMVLIAIISILRPFHPARKRISPNPLQLNLISITADWSAAIMLTTLNYNEGSHVLESRSCP